MDLALKYRPKDFSEVVGQKATSTLLSSMISKNILEQVLLFTGPSGVGKTSMARIIAAKLNPSSSDDVFKGTHPSVLEIDAASNGSVDAIRQLKKDLRYVVPGHRVIIIDEVHAVSPEGFTALLNLLEFPVPNVTIILITTEEHKIPITVRHRCDKYVFKKASIHDLAKHLQYVAQQENINANTELLELIAQRSEGSHRKALKLFDQLSSADVFTVEQFNDLHGEVDYGPLLLKSAIDGPISIVSQLDSVLKYTNPEDVSDRIVETLRDIMLLKGKLPVQCSSTALEAREKIANVLTMDQIIKSMKIIWDLQTKLSKIDSVRGLELAFSLIGEILQKKPFEEPARVSAPMSFAQMQANRG